MAIRMSRDLKNSLLFGDNLVTALDYGVIQIYTGEQPEDANSAPTGTLLASITNNGLEWQQGSFTGGLRLVPVPALSYAVKPASQFWVLKAVQTGEAGWWRFRSNASASLNMDGAITAPQNELFIGDSALTEDEERVIQLFQIGFYW